MRLTFNVRPSCDTMFSGAPLSIFLCPRPSRLSGSYNPRYSRMENDTGFTTGRNSNVGRTLLIPDPGYRSPCRLCCPRPPQPWRRYSLFFSLRTTYGTIDEPSCWSTRYCTHLSPFRQWRTPTVIHLFPLSQLLRSADPSNGSVDKPEADDRLHWLDPRWDILNDSSSMFTLHGLANLGCFALLLLGTVTLLYAFSPFFLCGIQFLTPAA